MPSRYFIYFKLQIFYQLLKKNSKKKKKKLHNNNNDKSLTTKVKNMKS